MTHTEIFTTLHGNSNKCQALIHGYGKHKTDWYDVVAVLGIHSEYTLKVKINGKESFIPNRVVKQVRILS